MAEVNKELGREMSQKEMQDAMTEKRPPTELSAVVLPDFGRRDEANRLQPATEEEAMHQLQSFLAELNVQGADMVSILDVKVSVPDTPGVVAGEGTEMRKFAVIRKPKQA